MNIMNVMHHSGIFHNDLSKDNIMLQFITYKPNVVYIGVCDWGEAIHMQEMTPSMYALSKARFHQCEENALVGGPPKKFVHNKP
jgi:tRNA A-37 threonylcarbamoyl transferase component Bud32